MIKLALQLKIESDEMAHNIMSLGLVRTLEDRKNKESSIVSTTCNFVKAWIVRTGTVHVILDMYTNPHVFVCSKLHTESQL